jgi:hypothetical protein
MQAYFSINSHFWNFKMENEMNREFPKNHDWKIIELMWNGEGRIKIRRSNILPGERKALDEYNHSFNQPSIKAPRSDKQNPGQSRRRNSFWAVRKARRFEKQNSSHSGKRPVQSAQTSG